MHKYIAYLEYLNRKLSKYFQDQEPYIFCKKGCAKCCQQGDYPFKEIEVEYLLYGFSQLPNDKKQIILQKIQKLKQEKLNNQQGEFMYECPFLINKECSVYEYRGVICRTFGLISSRENANSKVPFCAFEGLNYSNVLDADQKVISEEKFLALHTDIEPLAYNVSYKYLTSEKFEKVFEFEFGEHRSLIDWFE